MWSWEGRLWRSNPGEPPARVFTEEEEMEEVYELSATHNVGTYPPPSMNFVPVAKISLNWFEP